MLDLDSDGTASVLNINKIARSNVKNIVFHNLIIFLSVCDGHMCCITHVIELGYYLLTLMMHDILLCVNLQFKINF